MKLKSCFALILLCLVRVAAQNPPDIETTHLFTVRYANVDTLRGIFNYQEYRLLETAVTRTRDGGHALLNGMVPKQSDGLRMPYQLSLGPVAIAAEGKERTIRINDLKVTFSVPMSANQNGAFNHHEINMNTDVDLREGQKVVIGKSNIDGSNDAMILVVTAKLVN